MLSAPNENYEEHIMNCLNEWDRISSRFFSTLNRLFGNSHNEINENTSLMIYCHDVGKLTQRWQEIVERVSEGEKRYLPPHAALGAAYLFELSRVQTRDNNLVKASCFAILIHHIDRGIVGNNLESPDAQAILNGLTKGEEEIRWHKDADEFLKEMSKNQNFIYYPLTKVTLKSLRELSEDLRRWSKCPRLLEQHKNRILASSLHHILKVCDWRASSKREAKEDEESRKSILESLLSGGLLI